MIFRFFFISHFIAENNIGVPCRRLIDETGLCGTPSQQGESGHLRAKVGHYPGRKSSRKSWLSPGRYNSFAVSRLSSNRYEFDLRWPPKIAFGLIRAGQMSSKSLDLVG